MASAVPLRMIDTFSGIGGFSLAARWLDSSGLLATSGSHDASGLGSGRGSGLGSGRGSGRGFP
jgi:hypothetical protein